MPNTGVKGRITDAETGQGIPGLTVTVVDFDPFFNEDDVLKKAVVESTDGSFQFVILKIVTGYGQLIAILI